MRIGTLWSASALSRIRDAERAPPQRKSGLRDLRRCLRILDKPKIRGGGVTGRDRRRTS
ncbi:hypothetical protein CHELA17_63328 [Chelatococcus asaccharovorans]|nr:hypothetical protein CHELA17_63328 [Chelatococcus asaccharovorans]